MDGNPSGSGLFSTIYVPQGGKQSPVQLVFGRDIILPITHISGWRYIHQRKQAQVYKDVIRENTTRINYDYILGYQVLIRNKSEFKY